MTPISKILAAYILAFELSACGPEVGSKEWCEDMADKPKGDWSANDAADYTKYCILKNYK
jgi:hypothetical protein